MPAKKITQPARLSRRSIISACVRFAWLGEVDVSAEGLTSGLPLACFQSLLCGCAGHSDLNVEACISPRVTRCGFRPEASLCAREEPIQASRQKNRGGAGGGRQRGGAAQDSRCSLLTSTLTSTCAMTIFIKQRLCSRHAALISTAHPVACRPAATIHQPATEQSNLAAKVFLCSTYN